MDPAPDRVTGLDSWPGLRTGQILGNRFEIRQIVEATPLRALYSGWDREARAEVAIQAVLLELSGDGRALEDVRREARAASRLDHPGLVRTLDAFLIDGLLVIVTEFLDAPTLRSRLDTLKRERRRFSIAEVRRIGAALCDTLSYVHGQVAHGGVTPANIFLCSGDRVTLAGFGSNRFPGWRDSQSGTDPLAVVPYVAPEQLTGATPVDHRADQYSVAAALYEMLTGQAPVGRLKSPRELRRETPRSLSRALDRALNPDPSARFKDIDELANALSGRGSRTARFAGIGVVALLVVCAIVFAVKPPEWFHGLKSPARPSTPDPRQALAAQNALSETAALAARCQELEAVLPAEFPPAQLDEARSAMAFGQRHIEESSYADAQASLAAAATIYEACIAAATDHFQADPAGVAAATQELIERWEELGQQLAARVTDSIRQLDDFRRAFGAAGSEAERQAAAAGQQEAAAELDLMNRLKLSALTHAFGPIQRGDINGRLQQADAFLEASQLDAAMSVYAGLTERLEQLLDWPVRAEIALREEAALVLREEQTVSVLGPAVEEHPSVATALEQARAHIARGTEELQAGRIVQAREAFALARDALATTTEATVKALFERAEALDRAGEGTGAILTLEELLALDADHAQALALRADVLAYRLTNSFGMELVFVPPGSFLVGSPQTELGRDQDERQRSVQLSTGFYISTTEVTQSQWSAIMDTNPSRWLCDDLPVDSVSWQGAMEFCRRLSEHEAETYRLPTETEWEYACRAGTTTAFSFGETMTTHQANYDGRETSADSDERLFRAKTLPVASFLPNPWGLFDMHGNVWEWCVDETSSVSEIPPTLVAESPPIKGRVLRGGSWRNRARFCRSANRVTDTEGSVLANIGFRVVLERR